jgi:hypothetical protein
MKKTLLVLAFLGGGCGLECELQSGPWVCQMTAESVDGNCASGVRPGWSFSWDYVVAESDYRECASETVNEGPVYDGANQVYFWYSGTMNGVDSDRIEGHVTYRFSAYATGDNACVISGSIICVPN